MSRLKRIRTRINKENLEKAQKEGHITEEQAQEVIDTNGLYNPYTDTYINPDILPEISVTTKAPERTWTSEWTYNDPEFRLAREHRNIAAQEVAKSTRDKMNQVGNAIGKTIIGGTSFTPLWFAAPIAKAGIAASEGDYSGAAKEAAVGLLAPYAIGKGLEKGYRIYQITKPYIKGDNKLVQKTISSIKSKYPLAENSLHGKFNLSLSSKEQQALNEEVAKAFSESGQPVNTTIDMFGEPIPDAKSEWIKFIKQQVNKNKNFGQGVWHIDHVNNIPKNNILTDGREYQYTWWDISPDIRNGHIGSHTPEAHNVIYYFPFGSKGSDIVLNSPIAPSGHMNYKKVGPIDISEAIKYKWNGKSWIQENNLTQYAKGGNIKRNNISKREISTIVKKPFEDWYKTVPADRNDTITYNLRRAYELAPIDELETWRTSSFKDLKSGKNHLGTVYFNPDTGIYEFVKSKDHESLQSELDWFYSNDPEAIEFRNNYYLDTSNDFYKYIPKKKSGGRIHIKPENRGKFTEYCGGKVTDECIQRAKRSGNKKLIKRAVFAENARKWKH